MALLIDFPDYTVAKLFKSKTTACFLSLVLKYCLMCLYVILFHVEHLEKDSTNFRRIILV